MPFDPADDHRTPTLLVVDDETELRKLLTRVLEAEQICVHQASGAREALDLLKKSVSQPESGIPPFDLALLDVALPDMNGMTLFAKMQQDERLRQIPVIFLTGDAEYHQKARAFEAGAVDYITKPFQRKDLVLRIRAHVRDKWQRDREQEKAVGDAAMARLSLNEAEQRFSALVRNSFHLVCELDEGLTIRYASPNHVEILAYQPAQVEQTYWPDFVHPNEQEDVIQFLQEILSSGSEKRMLMQFRDGGGHWRWLDVCGSVLTTGSGALHLLLVSRDVTHTKETERYLQHLALHDSLTGLSNRQNFTDELERLNARHPEGAPYAVMYVDVDNFKITNDQHGHLIGDQVLRAVGEFLKRAFGPQAEIISRFGGDEFCVLIRAKSMEEAERSGEEMCEMARRNPILCSGIRHRITLSVGIALMEAGLGIEEVLSRANTALHAAKAGGKNRVCVYRSDNTELTRMRRSAEWFQKLHDGLEENRFEAWYQPLVELKTGEINHHEALIRLRGEDGYLHAPGSFMGSAERYGIMPQIDRYMIHRVLTDMVAHPWLRVAVNLSGASVTEPGMAAYIRNAFEEFGVDPKRIIFEITETVFMTNLAQARHIVEALQELGCRFALDDFGSGFSSLNYLRHLPVTIVKVDGSFIREVHADPVNLTLLKSINEIAHLLGKETVAEWIETEETYHLLKEIGFDYGQGFYSGRPALLKDLPAPNGAPFPG